jgi:hypothetical protein
MMFLGQSGQLDGVFCASREMTPLNGRLISGGRSQVEKLNLSKRLANGLWPLNTTLLGTLTFHYAFISGYAAAAESRTFSLSHGKYRLPTYPSHIAGYASRNKRREVTVSKYVEPVFVARARNKATINQ